MSYVSVCSSQARNVMTKHGKHATHHNEALEDGLGRLEGHIIGTLTVPEHVIEIAMPLHFDLPLEKLEFTIDAIQKATEETTIQKWKNYGPNVCPRVDDETKEERYATRGHVLQELNNIIRAARLHQENDARHRGSSTNEDDPYLSEQSCSKWPVEAQQLKSLYEGLDAEYKAREKTLHELANSERRLEARSIELEGENLWLRKRLQKKESTLASMFKSRKKKATREVGDEMLSQSKDESALDDFLRQQSPGASSAFSRQSSTGASSVVSNMSDKVQALPGKGGACCQGSGLAASMEVLAQAPHEGRNVEKYSILMLWMIVMTGANMIVICIVLGGRFATI